MHPPLTLYALLWTDVDLEKGRLRIERNEW